MLNSELFSSSTIFCACSSFFIAFSTDLPSIFDNSASKVFPSFEPQPVYSGVTQKKCTAFSYDGPPNHRLVTEESL